MFRLFATVALLAALVSAGFSAPQEAQTPPAPPQSVPSAPKDKPTHFEGSDAQQKMEKAIAPYVAKGKKTYPDAKARYLKGLSKGQRFYVTVKLTENNNRLQETVFVAVREIKGGKITGAIANTLNTLRTYKPGQSITFAEAGVLDWTISHPDGTEEGNFIGKFLDNYKP